MQAAAAIERANPRLAEFQRIQPMGLMAGARSAPHLDRQSAAQARGRMAGPYSGGGSDHQQRRAMASTKANSGPLPIGCSTLIAQISGESLPAWATNCG